MESPIVSIVIPCYNQGHFLKEALASIDSCDKTLFEVIIVNDGSSDQATNTYLEELSQSGYNVIFQTNLGLGEARNTGIKKSRGKFILPLDSDNKIHPGYITKGINILTTNEDIAVVYSNANYFGDKNGVLKPGPFNLQRLMLGNFIDACAMVRRSVIEEVGYYDAMKIMGYEDWDLWLRIAFAGYGFHYIDDTLFDYRVTIQSMMKNLNADIKRTNEIEWYIMQKYMDKLDFDFVENIFVHRMKKKPLNFFYRLLLKKYFPRRYAKLINENKIYRGHIYGRV